MKKIYSALALAAALTASASAADVKVAMVERSVAQLADIEAAAEISAPAKTSAKARPTNMAELTNLYEGTYYLPFDGYGQMQGMMGICANEEVANGIYVLGLTEVPVPGTVDFTTGLIALDADVEIGEMNFTNLGKRMVYLRHYVADSSGSLNPSSAPFYLMITEDGTVTAASNNDFYMGFIEGRSPEGWWVTGGGRFKLVPYVDDSADWQTIGECSLLDEGFVSPYYNATHQFPQLTCENFQQHKTKPYLLRLLNPYDKVNEVMSQKIGKEVVMNISPFNGSIILDATYPDCVQVPDNFNGYYDGNFFFSSNNEYQEMKDGATPEDLKGFLENFSYINTDANMAVIYNCVARWGTESFKSFAEYYAMWGVTDEPTPSCTFTILLPEGVNLGGSAIEEINADANVAPVYYNLQGVRVDNPAKGLYIRVQGKKATKVVL